jgi:hypothetical protein
MKRGTFYFAAGTISWHGAKATVLAKRARILPTSAQLLTLFSYA